MKKIIIGVCLLFACITQANCNSCMPELTEGTIRGGAVTVSTEYPKDFKSHFGGYIFGINKILARRDKRHKEWSYSPINSSQIKKLLEFLDGKNYNRGTNNLSIPNSKNFWAEYEKITGRKK